MPFPDLPLYFENAAGQLREHPAGYAVLHYTSGPRQPGTFAEFGTQVGRLLLARQWHRLLSDQRELSILSDAEKEWVTTQWLPQHVARPAVLHEALLVARDVFARLAIGQALNQTSATTGTITLHYCADEAAAHTYLLGLGTSLPG